MKNRGFDVGPFVLVLQKLRTIERVENGTCATLKGTAASLARLRDDAPAEYFDEVRG